MTGREPWVLACAVLLAGCATAPPHPVGVASGCHEVFARADRAVAEAGVADAQASRIAGFPYLRVDRVLASYSREVLHPAAHDEWVRRMRALGSAAHAIELSNLAAPGRLEIEREVARCAGELAALDAADPSRREALRQSAVVPDDYSTANRVAGLYWLARIPFALGVRRWHDEVGATFAADLAALPVAGELKRFAPSGVRLGSAEVAAILARASANPLGIPTPEGRDLDALFGTFAPVYTVDTATTADIPGPLALRDDGTVGVRGGSPVVYRRISHARAEGQVLLQLNYAIWFPQRPKRGAWDLLGGHLDGVIWRVTLSPSGEPLLFDTIHACGCYHLFIPTARANPKEGAPVLDEPAFVPQRLPAIEAGAIVELRIAAGSHYLQRVVVDPSEGLAATAYTLEDDDRLRSLADGRGGRKSAFRSDGLVAGTERAERWLFWPMGVAQAGSMRQWGRHATAFVGRRHFDDPGLLSRYFDLVIIP